MHLIHSENFPTDKELNFFFENFSDLSAHQRILNNALGIMKEIPEIEAIFLGGSLALNKGDIFSDVDLILLPKNINTKNLIFENLIKDIDKIGAVIHSYYSMSNREDLIVYFKPFIKLELSIKSFEKICNSWKTNIATKLLFDRNGIGATAIENAKAIKYSIKKYEFETRNFAIAIPSLCIIAAGYLSRGEYITAMDFVAWIRRNLVRISGFLLGLWDEGTRKAEERFPKLIIEYYYKVKIDTISEVWKSLETILSWYSKFIVPKLQENGITHVLHEIEPIINIIKKIKQKSR